MEMGSTSWNSSLCTVIDLPSLTAPDKENIGSCSRVAPPKDLCNYTKLISLHFFGQNCSFPKALLQSMSYTFPKQWNIDMQIWQAYPQCATFTICPCTLQIKFHHLIYNFSPCDYTSAPRRCSSPAPDTAGGMVHHCLPSWIFKSILIVAKLSGMCQQCCEGVEDHVLSQLPTALMIQVKWSDLRISRSSVCLQTQNVLRITEGGSEDIQKDRMRRRRRQGRGR